MDRKTRIAMVCSLAALVCACGGGGGGSGADASATAPVGGLSPTAPTSPSPSPAATLGQSSNIVAWGDSLTPAFALNLQVLMTDRGVANDGFLGATSTAIANNAVSDTDHRNWINVFWYGQNNEDDPDTIKADIARSVAHLAPGNTHFIVLGVVNKSDGKEKKGTGTYNKIVKLNAELAALYPDNFIDIRAWLVAHYNPNDAGDVQDHDDDQVPRSLRYDEIHLRNEGSLLVAQRVREFIAAKGW